MMLVLDGEGYNYGIHNLPSMGRGSNTGVDPRAGSRIKTYTNGRGRSRRDMA